MTSSCLSCCGVFFWLRPPLILEQIRRYRRAAQLQFGSVCYYYSPLHSKYDLCFSRYTLQSVVIRQVPLRNVFAIENTSAIRRFEPNQPIPSLVSGIAVSHENTHLRLEKSLNFVYPRALWSKRTIWWHSHALGAAFHLLLRLSIFQCRQYIEYSSHLQWILQGNLFWIRKKSSDTVVGEWQYSHENLTDLRLRKIT